METLTTPVRGKTNRDMQNGITDDEAAAIETFIENTQWEENMDNLYSYDEGGFCDGFANY